MENLSTSTKVAYSDKVGEAFIKKVIDISQKININPSWLMMVMYKETGGTFSPSIKNPTSTASGLIQFMEATAKQLGTTTAKLRKMSAIEQLDYVYLYFKPFTNKLNSFSDTYFAVFYPKAIGKPDTWKFPEWVYRSNRGLDLNKNGIITVGEFKTWAARQAKGIVIDIKKK